MADKDINPKRPLAVVTGASSGLGEEYARTLARDGYDLLLIARRAPLLETLKATLESEFHVNVELIVTDLADVDRLKVLETRLRETPNLEILVNNAGYGFETGVPVEDIERECRMIDVHVVAPMRLSHAAVVPMLRRHRGYIINVSSVAAFLHGPECSQYAATKAYLLSFSKCLQSDVRGRGVYVQALCPGFVRTGFHSTDMIDEEKYRKIPNFLWLKRDRVVRDSLRTVRKRRTSAVYVPSLRYKFILAILTFPLFSAFSELIYRVRAKMSKR